MNLGLYVGSFDPVHKAHINIAKRLIKKKVIDKLLFVPTKNYWDKNNLTDIKHRVSMLKLYENKKILVDSEKNKYEYTYQIIESIKAKNKKTNIFLIIGADNIEKFHLWKNVNEILRNKVIVITRDDIDISSYIKKFEEKNQFMVFNLKTNNISSTLIRQKIKNKETLTDFLDKKVVNYIKEEKLYGGD